MLAPYSLSSKLYGGAVVSLALAMSAFDAPQVTEPP